jgi:hypothetical protein
MSSLRSAWAAVIAFAVATPVLSASTVDLQVTGTLVPSACTPSISTANLHFGTISSADLSHERPTPLVEHAPTLTVRCGSPTLYGLRLIDNRAGSAYESGLPGRLGMGHSATGERLGAYHLDVVPARSTADARPVFVTLGDRTGQRWSTSTAQPLALPTDGELLGLVDRAGVDTGAVAVQVALLGLRAHGMIAPARGLTLVDAVPLDGHVTVEVVYL